MRDKESKEEEEDKEEDFEEEEEDYEEEKMNREEYFEEVGKGEMMKRVKEGDNDQCLK